MSPILYPMQIVHLPVKELQYFQNAQFVEEVKNMNTLKDIDIVKNFQDVELIRNIKNNPKTKGYITGFFDAEGCIDITVGTLQIHINQVYKPILEKIGMLFKSKITIHSKESYDNKGIHRKEAYRFKITSEKALSFLEYILQFSIEKKSQIKVGLNYQRNIKIYHEKGIDRLKGISQLEIEQRKNYSNLLTTLKKENSISNIPEMPEDIQLGYFAGFFDGEGCVRIDKGNKGSYTLRIELTNSCIEILKLFQNKYGGKIREHVINKSLKNNHKKIYIWSIHSNNSLTFLKEIYPLTIVKFDQIKYAIEFQEWHNHIGIISIYHKQIAEQYYTKLKELKSLIRTKECNMNDMPNISDIILGNPFRTKLQEAKLIKKYLENSKLGFENIQIYNINRGYNFTVTKKDSDGKDILIKICSIGRNLDYSKVCNSSRWGIKLNDIEKSEYFIISLWNNQNDIIPKKVFLIHKDEIIRGSLFGNIKDLSITNNTKKLKEFEKYEIFSIPMIYEDITIHKHV